MCARGTCFQNRGGVAQYALVYEIRGGAVLAHGALHSLTVGAVQGRARKCAAKHAAVRGVLHVTGLRVLHRFVCSYKPPVCTCLPWFAYRYEKKRPLVHVFALVCVPVQNKTPFRARVCTYFWYICIM